jgi:hypothetical protein
MALLSLHTNAEDPTLIRRFIYFAADAMRAPRRDFSGRIVGPNAPDPDAASRATAHFIAVSDLGQG